MPSTTKRSQAQSQAQKPVVRKKRTSETVADISRTHELIVDAVTTMLSTGGHTDDVDTLLHATMAHTRRRTFDHLVDNPAEMGQLVEKFIRTDFDKWKFDLQTAWRKNARNEVPAVSPQSLTERILLNVREEVWDLFERFMGCTSPEELRFVLEVLETWHSNHLAAETGSYEIFIASAFETELGRNACYVKIPERMLDHVQKYIFALKAIDDKAAE